MRKGDDCLNEKVLGATLIFIAFLVFVGILYATYVITSPRVTVTVEEYALTLNVNATTCRVGESIEFSGTLTKGGTPIMGENIELFYSNNTTTGLTDTTTSSGSYSIVWTATKKGTYSFYTKAEIA